MKKCRDFSLADKIIVVDKGEIMEEGNHEQLLEKGYHSFRFTPGNGDLFFWLGVGIIAISIILLFILHIRLTVNHNSIILDGLWTTRKVKISLNDIVKAERRKYSRYHLNNPVFNLHFKGTIRFYTGGNDAVELTDRDGQIYRIGTQRPTELERIIKECINKNQS